jgi:hypothetical protein
VAQKVVLTYISHHLKLIFPNEGQRPNMGNFSISYGSMKKPLDKTKVP